MLVLQLFHISQEDKGKTTPKYCGYHHFQPQEMDSGYLDEEDDKHSHILARWTTVIIKFI